ncbi:MAG: ubiquinone biosynthesis methyltransferase UbiE [Alphaproteobacteria bacterium MedPE-SWcel]|nr:MAG: ubiquinone biosynthesis methyltransferase UbiE [Alphaproteobacteria bacterium MedPE-SWcel]
MPSDAIALGTSRDRLVFVVKWGASAVQIMGYTATGFGWTPLNLYLFLVGVVGWFAVGALWNDRALMLVHLAALGAMIAGMVSS